MAPAPQGVGVFFVGMDGARSGDRKAKAARWTAFKIKISNDTIRTLHPPSTAER